ncbi:MAG: NAD-dependent epimerase/dehydratase family protein [Candidatus Dadabacteria bacterium]|nr:MAG: NAD-dependent epimerase/dehydratase family protein [Candidatus Dadabacteria bacterium]
MTRALVTGASGFVGSRLCRELMEHGYQVRAFCRKGSKTDVLGSLEVDIAYGDIRDRESIERAMEDVEVVFHIAALFRQAKFPDQVYYDINAGGVKNVFEVAVNKGAKKVIHCSTVGVHSHIPNPPANEEEDYRPGDIYQETKCEGEKLALSYLRSGKISGAVIRPAMIWGPGDMRMLKLFRGIARRRFPLIGSGETLVHWVLVDDLVRAFRLAAETDGIDGEVFIIAGERPVKLRYLLEKVAEFYGVKLLPFRIPALPVQILGSIVEIACIPFGIEPPIYRRRVDFFTKTRAFDSSKAKKLLGYAPAQSFEDEVKIIGSWYKEQGLI